MPSALRERSEKVAHNETSRLFTPKLIVSILFGLVIWGFLFGSYVFSALMLFALLVHEYGHYYWMGREGITKRSMMVIPPFGAVARSYEYWPSFGAETRIALAGPAFGLLPVVLFFLLSLATGDARWVGVAGFAAFINLFNAIPALPLDGGRWMRGMLASIHPSLHTASFVISAVSITLLFLYLPSLLAIIVGFMFFLEARSYFAAPRVRNAESNALFQLEALRATYKDEVAVREILDPQIEVAKRRLDFLSRMLNLPRMNGKEIAASFVLGIFVYGAHARFMMWAMNGIGATDLVGLLKKTLELF